MDADYYSLIFEGPSAYVHSGESFLPVRLQEFEAVDKAKDTYLALRDCQNCYVAPVFGPFQEQEKIYIAALNRGTSLRDFVSSYGPLFVDPNSNRRASELYKKIISSLVVAGNLIIQKQLGCSFNLDTISVLSKDVLNSNVPSDSVHVEVTEFIEGDVNVMTGLWNCLIEINCQIAYPNDDPEMNEVLGFLHNGNISDLMRSSFFWDWKMKIDFISKVKEFIDEDASMRVKCTGIFNNQWMKQIQGDQELAKLLVDYQNRKNQQSPVCPISFIRYSFQNFLAKVSNAGVQIKDEKELQMRLESRLGAFIQRLILVVLPLESVSVIARNKFYRFIDASIWERPYPL